jgi:hypothetical protein
VEHWSCQRTGQKKKELQIAAQSCHNIINVFKKPVDQIGGQTQTYNENPISVHFYNFNLRT